MSKTKAKPLAQIENKPLRDRIADMLRELIVSAQLKPGETIIETELATQLGVSRAPLREALQILNTEGLIEIIPYHKTSVRKLTRGDITELYSLRSTLENFAIRQIIEHQDDHDLEMLRDVYTDMVTAAENGEEALASTLDHHFHTTIIHLSKHKLLISTWNTVSQRVRQVLALRDMRRSDMRKIAYSHLPLIEAIAEGDPYKANILMEEHIMNASDLIVEVWDDANGVD